MDYPYADCIYITVLVPEDEYITQTGNESAMYAAIDAKKGEDKQIKEYIDKNILKENDMINVFSVLDMKESFQRYVSKYYMIGSFLVVILAFIGIMNFFNTTATSVISRKKELVLLEVVGMTKKQISKMLVAEGFLYLGGAFVIAVLLIVFGAKQILVNTLGTAFFFRLHLTIVPCVLMIPILVEERDDTLTECCRALVEKKEELMKKSHLDTSVYVLFTKADRKVENLINKRNTGDLYIDEGTYTHNIQEVLADIEKMVHEYAEMLPQEEVDWLSMRYLKDSYILKSLEGDVHKQNFEPEGLFEKIVDYSMKTLRDTLPVGVKNPLFVTAIEPDKSAIQVSVDPERIKVEIESMQYSLCEETDIVNGYVISKKTPRLHGRSVYVYWNNLTIGLGHKTRASVYGNFEINMKGLLKRMLKNEFPSFVKFDENSAVKFTADNLDDDVLMEVLKTLYGNCDLEAGLNPAMGERNIALQRLYEFYVQFFMNEYRFASLIDRVAYDLSYGNPELKQFLTNIYNNTPGYDGAMRKLQNSFKVFFGSEHFTRILINELEQVMTEMVNKAFIII